MPSKSKSQHNLMAMVAHDPKAAKRVGIPQSVGRDYVEADKGRKFGDSKMKTKKYAEGGQLSGFGKAFRDARAAGAEQFTYGGKMYTTELAKDSKSSSSRAADSDDYKTNRPKVASSSSKSELNTFESGTKTTPKAAPVVKEDRIAAQRANAARSAAKSAAEDAERMARDKPPAPKVAPRAAAPTSAAPSDRIAAQRVNAARSAARDAEAAAERMARDKPLTAEQSASGRARAAREAAERMERDRPFGMKSGGSVYRRAADGITQRGKTKGTEVRMARGGSVSSASKRADGCATKGKTKGRFV